MKISVIIPVYNTEKYLKECVESVLAQTYHNLEILLINDGATDSSPQICESYAKQDARIKLIHKENGGLSDTRNMGIKQCSGDYVLFLDSDDYWDDPKMVEKLADQMQQYPVDILNFRYKKYMEDTKQFVPCLKSVEDIKQQEKLEKFFKEENTWFPDNVGEKFLAIFFFIISGILACAPNKMIDFSDLNNDMKVVLIGYMFYLLGVTYMVMKYKSYQEAYSTNRKRITTRELLKNMPIDRMQLWIFITKKKIKPCAVMTAIIIAIRIIITLAAYRNIYLSDILMVLVFNLIVPVLIA